MIPSNEESAQASLEGIGSRQSGSKRPAFRSASRLGWGFADQALSSLTNFVLGILVARSVSTQDLGAFGLALVTYWTALAIGRAMSSQPLVIRYAGVSLWEWRRGTGAATGTAVAVGVASGIVLVVLARLIGGALGDAFFALGLSLPGLLLQDCWRYAFLAAGRSRSAFVNDLAWTTAMFPAVLLVAGAGGGSLLWLMIAWGGSATLAAIFGILQSRVVPAPLLAGWWLRVQRDLVGRYVGEAVISMGTRQIGASLIATIGGLVVTGTLRAGDLLLSPLNVLFQGMHLIGVPEGVRALNHSRRRLLLFTIALSSVLTAVVTAWSLLLILLPEEIGRALLKQAWDPARSVLIPLALTLALGSVATGATIGLRVLAAASRSLRVTTIGSFSALAGCLIGVTAGGAQGVAWAIVIVAAINVGIWWWQFERALVDHRNAVRSPTPGGDGATTDPASPGRTL